ncbi:endoribonuclease l-psp family [Fusarium beomiforme]|uniref:Endoribonuclease l-psp family n=1 Tax=Fusarium beomiforme TaxID=44412 RepID=A0A9P5E3P0_9HYPO|nr:endoribonuclease l-psp family [Fusarium beomiforme]
MASFKYTTPPGFTQTLSDAVHYSQAVDLGNGHFKISGQGGWNSEGEISSDIETETEQTIQNVEDVLKAAGLRGWEDVYYVRSYHTDVDATLSPLAEALKKRIPDNRPGGVVLGVAKLALQGMRLEIEVDAKRSNSMRLPAKI